MYNKKKMDVVHNPIVDSLYSNDRIESSSPPPPVFNDFLLLDGTNFLLLDGTNFSLL